MSRACLSCGLTLPRREGRGRPRDYCNTDCRRDSLNDRRRRSYATAAAAVRYVRSLPPEARPELEPWRTEHGGLL